MKVPMICCLVLALLAATFYFLMGFNLLTMPSLSSEEAPPAISFVAGACYIIGGLLILLKKRWLWITGTILNSLVITIFFMMYYQRPEILVSAGGMGTKISQVLLDIGLIYLVISYRNQKQVTASKGRG